LRQTQTRAKSSAFKDRQGYGRADGPQAARRIEEGPALRLSNPPGRSIEPSEERCLGHADAGVCGSHAAFGGGNVGPSSSNAEGKPVGIKGAAVLRGRSET